MRRRVPLLAAALLALIGGVWGGLVRLAWDLPPIRPELPAVHGLLMVSGFLGTLIALERAVAIRRRWSYAAPILAALGVLTLLVAGRSSPAALLFLAASIVLLAASLAIVRLQPLDFSWTMALGAGAWVAGNVLWLAGRPLSELLLWWVGFPALTIAGERLQLSRLRGPAPRGRAAFFLLIGLFLVGALGAALMDGEGEAVGWRLVGAALLGLGLWLVVYDIARRNLRDPGLRRFIGVCLLSGYAWLAFAGAVTLRAGSLSAGPLYDAFVHAVFLGFVFSLIFGHAPIILPSIAGKHIPFSRSFYLHVALLHASLILRVAGDLAGSLAARGWGGLLNAAALLLFPILTARAAIGGARRSAGAERAR